MTTWMAQSKSDYVFTRDGGVEPVSAFTVIQQQERMRKLLNLPWDACVHSARHTALTNLGLSGVDQFTMQRLAGHASVTTSGKYVHPTPESSKDAFRKKVRRERAEQREANRKHRASAGQAEHNVARRPAQREHRQPNRLRGGKQVRVLSGIAGGTVQQQPAENLATPA
jgi:hypothetical protein